MPRYRNFVLVDGYLGTKPKSRTLPSGTAVANAKIAEQSLVPGDKSQWFRLSFYGPLAARAIKCDTGDHLFVKGRIEQREFTPEDGHKRTISEVVVDDFYVIARNADARVAGHVPVAHPDVLPADDWPVGLEQ